MPNHFHGIVMLTNRTRAEASSAPTLGAVIQTFKSICATDYLKQIRKYHLQEIARFWQKNYYERIIRNDDELSRMREYISQNPMHWNKDRYNP
jgi:REP element-mobilizing transposase RayT